MNRTTPGSPLLGRRDFLERSGMGLAMLGLASLVSNNAPQTRAATGDWERRPLTPRSPHFRPRAKRVIHIFLNGGPSHVDTFDPKPMLSRYAGKDLPTPNLQTESPTGQSFPSPFAFRPYGQSGIEVSELFAEVGEVIDECCVIRSMYADVPNHEPSLMLMNCGDGLLVRPAMGSWLTYGLGSDTQDLPGFIAMCPGGYPIKGPDNWRSAFLPGVFQGMFLDTERRDAAGLISDIETHSLKRRWQRRQLDLIQSLNRRHERGRESDGRLEARIQSFEQAYCMQAAALDVFDLEREPESVRKMYGDSQQARQILLARRLAERGVRFVQVWHGAGQPWDSHENVVRDHRNLARECSQPIAALIRDLKQRGLLDETLVIVCGEFGRTPTSQGSRGRDHNHYGFSVLLAGGGVRGGMVHGATDKFGWRAVEDPVHVHDLHATILHLLGLDHERLTYRHAGRDFRLTDVYGRVVDNIIA